MRVLIVHESRYGSTQGIAERIATTLRQHGLETVVRSAEVAIDPMGFDAVVIGSAVYYFHWMKQAKAFLWRNREALAERPVWLFSSGPLGTKTTDDKGRDIREATQPKEIAELCEAVHARNHKVFFGVLDPKRLGFLHRLMFRLPMNRDQAVFPQGDFRDWDNVDAWAHEIANELQAAEAVHSAHDAGVLV